MQKRQAMNRIGLSKEVKLIAGSIHLPGYLTLPKDGLGIVIFAHGSGSSRLSPRNLQVAQRFNQAGLGTLLFDLLTQEEALDRENVFNIPFLAHRLVGATEWIRSQKSIENLPIGYFGASTGGAAALWAAADLGDEIAAIVSRGGRPDLAIPRLKEVKAPTLLIVGGHDEAVIEMNQVALEFLSHGIFQIIPGASHLFEEPGTLEAVAEVSKKWFTRFFRFHLEKRSVA